MQLMMSEDCCRRTTFNLTLFGIKSRNNRAFAPNVLRSYLAQKFCRPINVSQIKRTNIKSNKIEKGIKLILKE